MADLQNGETGAGGSMAMPAEAAPRQRRHPWHRFVALGDSFTEGIGDPVPGNPEVFRGWADRVAEELSTGTADFSYANLAVRGLLLHEVLERQMATAIDLHPDLVSFQAGGNDLLHPGADPDKLAALVERAVMELRALDATVVLFVGPDSGKSTVMGQFRTKIAIYNENVRGIALHHDAVVADLWALTALHDPGMWGPDRLHPSAMGHHTVATMVLDTLNVPHTLLPMEPKPLPAQSWRQARAVELLWARDYFMPWVLDGLKGNSRTGGFQAKRPFPTPVNPAPGVLLGNPVFGNPVPPPPD